MDADWKPVEVELEAIAVNGNGHHAALEPTVELVPGIGHNGNGNDDESQRSSFSWAEFMAEEPTKPKGRKGKLHPPPILRGDIALCRGCRCSPPSASVLGRRPADASYQHAAAC